MANVILVDESDNEIGSEEKLAAHKKGLLHRAFSILIYNSAGEMLIQKRAKSKYHSGGLWTNACCSHPEPGEKTLDATHRRLQEELGFDSELKEVFSFQYKTNFGDLLENEIDHVHIGKSDETPKENPEEAEEYKYIGMEELVSDIEKNPQDYTSWFKIIVDKLVLEKLVNR